MEETDSMPALEGVTSDEDVPNTENMHSDQVDAAQAVEEIQGVVPEETAPVITPVVQSEISLQERMLALQKSQNDLQALVLCKIQVLGDEQRIKMDALTQRLYEVEDKLMRQHDSGWRDVIKVLNSNMDYHRSQVLDSLKWRLQKHHAEILQDINSVFTPFGLTLDSLQKEAAHTTQQLELLGTDMAAVKQQSLHLASLVSPASLSTESTSLLPPVPASPRSKLQFPLQAGSGNKDMTTPSHAGLPIQHSSTFSVQADESVRRTASKMPIKMEFPSFGKKEDSTDPLLYLERCRDFLTLRPLTDEELMATMGNVLHGTARDWWDVARHTVTKWSEFETQFVTAFLAEDYQEELENRVRDRVQGEKESLRDFVYSYHALCRKWKADIGEPEVLKLILKNINPQMASQLRGRVNTVATLVRLGQQLEKDKEGQQQYEQRQKTATKAAAKSELARQDATPPKEPTVFCWRCKEVGHPPANCQKFPNTKNSRPGKPTVEAQHPGPAKGSQAGLVTHADLEGGNRCFPTWDSLPSNPSPSKSFGQLIVPLTIRTWTGTAILDTGASFTLMSEQLWKELRASPILNPWTKGPLFLADGAAKQPLGWVDLPFSVAGHTSILPCVVLSVQSLAFPVVLGLDFMVCSGIQINVMDNQYWFTSHPQEKYNFVAAPVQAQPSSAFFAFYSVVPPPWFAPCGQAEAVLEDVLKHAQLTPAEKEHLQLVPLNNTDVCTSKLGRTTVLQHKIHFDALRAYQTETLSSLST